MAAKSKSKRTTKTPKPARTSVSFSVETYAELERIADQKKVSIAWVVREAAEKYVAEQYPLFGSALPRA